jgi:probable rRNA maturation factor
MKGDLRLFNRQRSRRVDRVMLRALLGDLLGNECHLDNFDLTIHLVAAPEMARLNARLLGHAGSTDVITLDYANPGAATLAGELFVCLDEALLQAPRFRCAWQTELARYLVHGILHLRGYDDTRPAARRKMKREENRLLRILRRRFRLSKLGLKSTVCG